jgi:hypothetical protein
MRSVLTPFGSWVAIGELADEILEVVLLGGLSELDGDAEGERVAAGTGEVFAEQALPWWFVTNLRGLHPRALVESPASFRRRGVFITTDALERV